LTVSGHTGHSMKHPDQLNLAIPLCVGPVNKTAAAGILI